MNNWFTTDIEEYPRETSNHEPNAAPQNNNKMTISPQPEPHVKENTASKGSSISAVNERLDIEVVKNTLNLFRARCEWTTRMA